MTDCRRLSEHDPHGDCPGIAGFSPPSREARDGATWEDVNDEPDPNADLIGLRVEAEERGVTLVVTGTPWYGGQYVDVDVVDKHGKVVGKSGMQATTARAAKASRSV